MFEKLPYRFFLRRDLVRDISLTGEGGIIVDYCLEHDCKYVEISNGTIPLTNVQKARYITEFSRQFTVFSEVGYKDDEKSSRLDSSKWIEFMREDLEAGATKVITGSGRWDEWHLSVGWRTESCFD